MNTATLAPPTAAAASTAGSILVVDDHARARQSIADTLTCVGHRVHCCSSASEALRVLQSQSFDVIITDLMMPGMNGMEFIRALEHQQVESQILMVTAHATVASAVEAMRHGAFDYIEKPFDVDQLETLVSRALRHGDLVGRRSSVPADDAARAMMIGDSPAMQLLRERIAQTAPTDITVLITGESGTGKELVARSIHASSRRVGRAMVGLNCPALSPQLMESELFGHEQGAFTSADSPRVGRFELADGGTILLDEVSEIDLALQAKLLRVLQEKSFERVGSSDTRSVDVRVLASTNRDLRHEVSQGRFREDLYFRLAVVPLNVPPLRSRREDIPLLAAHFLQRTGQRLGREPRSLAPAAADLLLNYHWPGNVRELENLVTRASVLGASDTVAADELRAWLIDADGTSPSADALDEQGAEGGAAGGIPVGTSLQDMERALIEATLEEFDGHRAKTAQALGIGIRTLCNKLRSYGYAPRAKAPRRAA
ncbi:MAG: sigma-54 dependent transcriptional regulator [Pirellulaceae bacterium]